MSYLELTNELKMIKHDSVFANVIRNSPNESIEMIKSQIKDARLVVVGIIGERLVTVIEKM